MGTRSLTALDYLNDRTHKVPRRVSALPLGDLQQTYLPAQPVLSSRTVDIDLPGTRTYRQKSTLDIIEEQQRLIRQLYTKPRLLTRVTVSAPARNRTIPTPSCSFESNIGKVQIEVKGRPLTSGASVSGTHKENSPVVAQRRPKTAGHLKHVYPLTDCHRAVTDDRDLLAISYSSQKLSNKLHSYWKSEISTLAVGKFVRGKKCPGEALPTLDSWLTFGGAAGVNSQGVVDAFASFKNSEEYYNIEGSVGSRVARQLQKGDKIRIGINGILQTQDLKVKKWNTHNVAELKVAGVVRDSQQKITKEGNEESLLTVSEPSTNSAVEEVDSRGDQMMPEEETEKAELVTNIQPERSPSEIDFGELVISALDDFQGNTSEVGVRKSPTPVREEVPVDTAPEASVPDDDAVGESLGMTTPLSWSDQCSKANIKIIQANMLQREISKPVMSETFPVKFQKLTDGAIRPKLVEVKSERFKIKQRSAHESTNSRENSSKVKVVYIDHLTTEEDEMVQGLSVDNIINHKLEGRSKVNTSILAAHGLDDEDKKSTNTDVKEDKARQPGRASSTRSEPRSSHSTSCNSLFGDRGSIYNPKLKVTPVHSSVGHKVGNLRIMSASSGQTSVSKNVPRLGKTTGKLTSTRPVHRTSAGQGSSIKAGPLKVETEYIKIISQLKIPTSSAPIAILPDHAAVTGSDQLSAGRNSPENLNDISNEAQLARELPTSATGDVTVDTSELPTSATGDVTVDASELPASATGDVTVDTSELPASATGDVTVDTSELAASATGDITLDASGTSSSKCRPILTSDSNYKVDHLNKESCSEDVEFPEATIPLAITPIMTAVATTTPLTTAVATSTPSTTAVATTTPSTTAVATTTPSTIAVATTTPSTTAAATSTPSTTAVATTTPSTTTAAISTPSTTTAAISTPSTTTAAISTPSTTAVAINTPSITAVAINTPSTTAAAISTPSITAAAINTPSITAVAINTPSITTAATSTPSTTAAAITTPSTTTVPITIPTADDEISSYLESQ